MSILDQLFVLAKRQSETAARHTFWLEKYLTRDHWLYFGVARTLWSVKPRLVFSAKGASQSQPGVTPQAFNIPTIEALKARFTSGCISIIVGVMPQSLSKVIIHIIFSTKNRDPWLDSDVRPRMHAYLATVCRQLSAEIAHVGGMADHVHIITTLPRTVSQAELIEQVKKASSKWIKTVDIRYRGFFWQRGYGAFSVSPSQLDPVALYVHNQQEHHRTRTFQEEYRDFLQKHGVDFDERYVWD